VKLPPEFRRAANILTYYVGSAGRGTSRFIRDLASAEGAFDAAFDDEEVQSRWARAFEYATKLAVAHDEWKAGLSREKGKAALGQSQDQLDEAWAKARQVSAQTNLSRYQVCSSQDPFPNCH
jgi:hypothetical protein